jgi:O-antigen/teichoic acid export membrane protein
MYGLLMSAVISLVIVYIFNLKFFLSLKLKTDIKMVLDMIRTGAPLLINGLVWTLMMSIDRFVILAFMTMTDLGIYSVALLGFSTLVLIPQSIAQVFYIKMSQDYGATNDVEILFNNAAKFTKILSLLSALISLLAYFSLPILIKFVMPKYIEGVVPAQILIIGVSLYSTTMLFSSVLNILKLNFKLLISTCILCLVSPILSISFIGIFGKSINSVAIGSSLSYLLYSLVVIIVTCKALHKKIFRILFISWVPVIFLILPCILISIFVNNFIMQVSFSIALIMLFLYTLYSRVLKSSIVTGGK